MVTASRIRRTGAIVQGKMVKLAERGRIEADRTEPRVGDALACVHVSPLDPAN